MSPGYGQDLNTVPDSTYLANKTIRAIRITDPPKIDGVINETFWQECPVARDFVQYNPLNGRYPSFPTEIRFAYDDNALYASAIMFDPYPDSICKELGRRDQVEQLNTDYISFDILPYNDDLNMFEFKVTPAGLQNDCKYTPVGQDITWDVVWESAARINDSSWVVEIKIPYSALRFPRIEDQVWGINMWRNLHRRQEYSTWTFVDNEVRDIFKYYGEMVGMKNIKPPIRLSITPYLSAYLDKNPGDKYWSLFGKGGMDLKFGISESFTLDMMLIPDFGQVPFDDQILNLTPFEIRYDEKRQFFTEATELFNKCGIFYSRRVGGTPKNYTAARDSLRSNEIITENPDMTRIINATKISGRNSKGLGIGFFNAITTNTWAVLEDTITGISRRISTQPFTNYNVSVLDQSLKNNSYFTFLNTNYWIPESRYCANVTGTETRICNAKNTFSFFGRLNVSQKYQDGLNPDFGHRAYISFSKPSGKFQYELSRDQMDDHYNPNDMGFLTNNNQTTNAVSLIHNIFDPVWKIRTSRSIIELTYSTLYKPYEFIDFQVLVSNQTTFSNLWSNYIMFAIHPYGNNNFYEPRVWGWVYKWPLNYEFNWSLETNSRKTIYYYNEFGLYNSPLNKTFGYWITGALNFRFSERFSTSLYVMYEKGQNDFGWVNTKTDSLLNPTIYFGRRDVTTVNNILNIKYIFTKELSLTLRVRHYWSRAKYFEFYILNKDGQLDQSDYWQNHDVNFNAFTADLQFIWYFSPGSELSIVWKNAINTQNDMIAYGYWDDFRNTVNAPQSNSLSVRILYYLDYLYLKKAFSKKKKVEK